MNETFEFLDEKTHQSINENAGDYFRLGVVLALVAIIAYAGSVKYNNSVQHAKDVAKQLQEENEKEEDEVRRWEDATNDTLVDK